MDRKRIWWLFFSCIFMPALLVLAAYQQSRNEEKYIIQMSLNGERMITLEYGQDYEDTGASAVLVNTDSGETMDVAVEVNGAVDTQRVGTYMLCYTAASRGKLSTIYRRVELVDTQIPTIQLVFSPDCYTLPGSEYVEEGFTALDNYDGDLTQSVNRHVTKDEVIYTVRDSSGNLTSVTRPIVYHDPIAPELTLKGDSLVIIERGDDYLEPGYTATDNCDGDLTQNVQVFGNVDTFLAGKYTLTYRVSDSFHNITEATRDVFVKEREVTQVNNPYEGDKVIYLTFDDGPGAYTSRLLDVLKKYNVYATFFVVDTRYIETIQRTGAEGHSIGIHTATHKFSEIYASEDDYFNDLYRMREIIKDYTGQTVDLLRFPGGSSNTVSSFNKGIMSRLTKMVQQMGFVYFDWNVDSKDAVGTKTAKQVYNNVISGIGDKENAVVLLHDIKSYSVDAMEKIIVWGLENGYSFRGLTKDSPTCHHGVNN